MGLCEQAKGVFGGIYPCSALLKNNLMEWSGMERDTVAEIYFGAMLKQSNLHAANLVQTHGPFENWVT